MGFFTQILACKVQQINGVTGVTSETLSARYQKMAGGKTLFVYDMSGMVQSLDLA